MTAEVVVWALLAHAAGDYLLQNDWLAVNKVRRWWPAALHGVVYGLPFIPLVPSVWAWLVIAGTHIVIDRYRLARFVIWARNQLAPARYRYAWRDGCQQTGFPVTVGSAHADVLRRQPDPRGHQPGRHRLPLITT